MADVIYQRRTNNALENWLACGVNTMILILMISHGKTQKARIKQESYSCSYSLRAGSVSDGQIMHNTTGEHVVLTQ